MNARLLLAAAFMIGGVVSAWAGSTIDPTKPVSGLPYTSAPIRNNFQALINDINALQQLTLTVANNAALHALNSTGFVTVTRLGFYAPDDGPRIIYTPTNAACTLNSGVGDDGSQVALANGKCAVAAFGNTDLVPEIWGCVGDGITADTNCLQKAVNAVQGTGRSLRLDRVYALDATIHIAQPIHITGPAMGTRAPTMTMPGFQPSTVDLTLLSLDGAPASGSTLENFTVRPAPANGVNTSGAAIVVNGSGNTNTLTDVTIQNLLIWSPCFGIDDQGSNESYYARNRIMAVYGTACSGIRLGLNTTAANTVGPRLDQNVITCNPSNSPSTTGRAGVLVLDAGGIYNTKNDVLYCVHGTEINPGANQQVIWPFFDNTVGGDSSHGNDIYINTSATTAQVIGAQITSSWSSNAGSQGLYSGSNGNSFEIRNDGGGLVRGISILGHRSLAGAGAFNSLNIMAGDDITVSNSVLCPTFVGGESAVHVGSSATNVKFIGDRMGWCYQSGGPSVIGGGLSIDTGAGVTMIVDNDFTNATVPISWTGLPSPDQGLIIKDNKGIDDVTPAAITPAASITLGFGPVATFTSGSTNISTMLNSWANRQVLLEPNGTINFVLGGNICNAISTNMPILATWSAGSHCWLMK